MPLSLFLNISQHQEVTSDSLLPHERREQCMYLKAPLQHPRMRWKMVQAIFACPTWTSNLYITHTHTTHKLEHLKQCARVKSDLTTKHWILKIKAMLMAMFPVLLAAICKWVEGLSRPSTEIFEQLFLLFSITWAISFDRPKNGKLNRVKRHPNPRPK